MKFKEQHIRPIQMKFVSGSNWKLKNIAGQVLTYNSKNFHWIKKTRPKTDYEWIGKTI